MVYDADEPTATTLVEVADKLGLEIVHDRRPTLAYVIRENHETRTSIERFQGVPKWPEAREPQRLGKFGLPEFTYGKLTPCVCKEFPRGGILFTRAKFDDDNSVARDDNMYFDGVSFDELAQYL